MRSKRKQDMLQHYEKNKKITTDILSALIS